MSNTTINTNVLALNSARAGRVVSADQAKASARLSSGLRINSAGDDAAGLAISEKMRAQIRGLDMAAKNSQDSISFIQVTEGGLSEINNMVQRIRELTVQAANETNTNQTNRDEGVSNGSAADTYKIAKEVSMLLTEIDEMAKRTEFNKLKMLDSGGSYHMQIGANSDQSMQIIIKGAKVKDLFSAGNFISGSDFGKIITEICKGGSAASMLLSNIDSALEYVTNERAKLGAYQNRLEYTIKSLEVSSENTSAAESRIRDTDMAKEMMKLTRANVLQQAANSMLAQANQAPQQVLQLLR